MTRIRLREALSEFFAHAGLPRKPGIRACGDRRAAFEDFALAVSEAGGDSALLLVDSEGPVPRGVQPWDYVRNRRADGWRRPPGATDDQLHFMVQCMEAWLIADSAGLSRRYGKRFRLGAIPHASDVEVHPAAECLKILEKATKDCPEPYRKTSKDYRPLEFIDPATVGAKSRFAQRLLQTLREILQR